MKTANAALIIAAGIILLWLVTSGRTKNLSAAWAALMGSVTGMAASATGGTTQGPVLPDNPSAPVPNLLSYNLPAFPSGINTSLPGLNFGADLPTLATLQASQHG